MQAEMKVARQRLSVLELAQKLGNVSNACRRRGMTLTQFYEYKKRFEMKGLEGLKDLPPVHNTHPQNAVKTLTIIDQRSSTFVAFRSRRYVDADLFPLFVCYTFPAHMSSVQVLKQTLYNSTSQNR